MRAARRLGRSVVLGLGLGAAASGCAVPVQAVCRQCPRLVLGERPPVPPGTRTVVVLVPGLLGYGWEWNGAQIALAQLPGAAPLVYDWQPWTSVREGGAQLAQSMQYLLQRLPGSVNQVLLLGHSAAGLLAVEAAAALRVPPGLGVKVLVIGSPLAGNQFNPFGGQDNFSTPIPLALAGTFTRWPEPAAGVELEIWPTGASDPVMRPRFGHDPADRRVLPRAAKLHPLPAELDHNVALGQVTRQLVAAMTAPALAAPSAVTAVVTVAAESAVAAPPALVPESAAASPPAVAAEAQN